MNVLIILGFALVFFSGATYSIFGEINLSSIAHRGLLQYTPRPAQTEFVTNSPDIYYGGADLFTPVSVYSTKGFLLVAAKGKQEVIWMSSAACSVVGMGRSQRLRIIIEKRCRKIEGSPDAERAIIPLRADFLKTDSEQV